MEKELLNLCSQFNVDGEFDSIEVVNNGHINSTFLVRFKQDGNINEYILQKINKYVFKHPDEVMQNIKGVTNHIVKKLKQQNKSTSRKTLMFNNSKSGLPYFVDQYGDFWRASEYIKNSTTFNTTDDLFLIEETGKAFGEFQNLLADFPAQNLNIIIPHFHNTPNRYQLFKTALAQNQAGRAKYVKDEIEQFLQLEELATTMYALQKQGVLKLKVTHNDTKCNNVLFDNDTKEHLCVIDLDTVMPGLIGFDFGDAIRFIANTSAEDEPNLSKVELDINKFQAFSSGFLSELKDKISPQEKDTLSLGAITITIECGLRFLTDYLDGDKYFKTHYPEHNLTRARCQLKLAQSMIEHHKEMDSIINQLCNTSHKSFE